MAPRRRVLLPFVLAALCAPVLIPATGAQAEDPSVRPPRELYLKLFPDMFTPGNVSSLAPHDDPLPQRPHPIDQETQRIHWSWWLDELPAPWVLSEGSAAELVVYLSNLDQTLAPVDPLGHPDSLGQARLIVRLDHLGETDPPAQGMIDVPTGTEVADGAVVELRVPLTVSRTVAYPMHAPAGADAPLFGINITLVAIASNRLYPSVHVDEAAPSRIHIADFPIAAYRAWEDAEAAAERCNDAILRGEGCPDDDPGDAEDLVATPGPPMLWLVIGLGALARAWRHRAPPHPPQKGFHPF